MFENLRLSMLVSLYINVCSAVAICGEGWVQVTMSNVTAVPDKTSFVSIEYFGHSFADFYARRFF
jgi:hypothetical protein